MALPPIDLETYPEHKQFIERSSQRGGAREHAVCWLCGAYCKSAHPPMLQFTGGGFVAQDPEGVDEFDQWHQPIGPNCLKKHPELKPYVVKAGESK